MTERSFKKGALAYYAVVIVVLCPLVNKEDLPCKFILVTFYLEDRELPTNMGKRMDGPYLFWKFKYIVIFTKKSLIYVALKRAYLVLVGKGKIQLLSHTTM